jgi:hypothetical protein
LNDGVAGRSGILLNASTDSHKDKTEHSTVTGLFHFIAFRVYRSSNFQQKKNLFKLIAIDAKHLDYLQAHVPSDELDLFSVPHSPFLSPCLASDVALKKLPPIKLLVSCVERKTGRLLEFIFMFGVVECTIGSLFGRFGRVCSKMSSFGLQCYPGCFTRFTSRIPQFRFSNHERKNE